MEGMATAVEYPNFIRRRGWLTVLAVSLTLFLTGWIGDMDTAVIIEIMVIILRINIERRRAGRDADGFRRRNDRLLG